MIKYCFLFLALYLTIFCSRKTTDINKNSDKKETWVFVMAGQSNMAGRGMIEPEDTITDKRILSINKDGQLILAKEPLHWYEPERTGLDCGFSFGKSLINHLPDSISVLLIPVAVGGSSISQWIGDSLWRGIRLFSNFKEKTTIAKQHGTIQGILWHQGESDANENDIPKYKERLSDLFYMFRTETVDNSLPILIGELGSFSKNPEQFKSINKAINDYSIFDKHVAVIPTGDLDHKGDSLHFNSDAQREMGKRFAETYMKRFYNSNVPRE